MGACGANHNGIEITKKKYCRNKSDHGVVKNKKTCRYLAFFANLYYISGPAMTLNNNKGAKAFYKKVRA